MTLANGTIGTTYTITGIQTDDEELNDFLFTLGCYSGEKITIVSMVSESYVVSIRDGRYNIDVNLADAIAVEA
ncbi:FeoA domain-containing protein [Chakrabartyella piscis]|uniref:FeoA domain-containing protein n=1 Tax=Chakrabartyella piscis TaxID=2918914 RepID=UPI00295886A9|nr:FeoA domain-containing protein [Chakrabartyella piscis]